MIRIYIIKILCCENFISVTVSSPPRTKRTWLHRVGTRMLRYPHAQLCDRDLLASIPGKLAGLQAQLGRNSADVLLETHETFHMFTKHSSFEKLPLPNENSLHLKVPFHSRDKENTIYFGLTPSGIKYRVKQNYSWGFCLRMLLQPWIVCPIPILFS